MTDQLITQALEADRNAQKLVPFFGRVSTDEAGSSAIGWDIDPRWYVEECEWVAGPNAGRAVCNIQLNKGSSDESANAVAFNANGPMKHIKRGTRAMVMKFNGTNFDEVYMTGEVAVIGHTKEDGSSGLSVTIMDDRDYLKTIRISGRYVADVGASEPPFTGVYQEGWPTHFNPGGRPNRIDDVNGDPMFAPSPDFGLSEGEAVPDPNSISQRKATYWTLGSIVRYIQKKYGTGAIPPSLWPYKKTVEDFLIWPDGFGDTIDNTAITNFDQGTGQNFSQLGAARKGRDIVLEGLSVFDALQLILKTAGGWTIGISPEVSVGSEANVSFTNHLELIPSRYDGGGVSIPYAAGGTAGTVLNRAVVTRGTYIEDGTDLITLAAGSGGLVFVETRVDTVTGSLEAAWTAAQLAAFKATVLESGQTTPEGFQRSMELWPTVFQMWKIKSSFDFYAGTEFASYPRAQIPRPIWSTLLTRHEADPEVTGIDGPKDYLSIPFPVRFEFKDDAGNWQTGLTLDGLVVWQNGLIHVPGLAMQGMLNQGGSIKWDNGQYQTNADGWDVSARDIRVTVAIPMDHRLTASIGLSNHTLDCPDFFGVWENMPDMDRIESYYKRVAHLDLGRLYELWLRKTSWPRPESLSTAVVQATDKLTSDDALRSDKTLLQNHLKRTMLDYGRLRKSGTLIFDGFLISTYKPGTLVKDLVPVGVTGIPNFPIHAVVDKVIWHCTPKYIGTELVLV